MDLACVSSTFSVKQMLVQSLRLRDKTFVIAFLNKYHADDACFSLFESVAAAPTEYALSNLSRGASARFLFLKWINLTETELLEWVLSFPKDVHKELLGHIRYAHLQQEEQLFRFK